MNHVAFDIAPERFEEYARKLHDKGIKTSKIYNHDDSPAQVSHEMNPGVFVRSIYFMDPDGILLEFASWTRVFDQSDVRQKPATAADAERRADAVPA